MRRAKKQKRKVAFSELVMKTVLVCMYCEAFDNLSIVLGARCSVDAGALSDLLGITGCQVFRNSTDTVSVCALWFCSLVF